jgi:hypothetical protein
MSNANNLFTRLRALIAATKPWHLAALDIVVVAAFFAYLLAPLF